MALKIRRLKTVELIQTFPYLNGSNHVEMAGGDRGPNSILYTPLSKRSVSLRVAISATVSMEKRREGQDNAVFSDHENTADNITPERARSMLQSHGMDVSLEQADVILRFLRRLAILALPQLFDK